MSYFTPTLKPAKGPQRPPTQAKTAGLAGHTTLFRDNFTTTTWLAMGAALQIIVSFTLGHKRALWIPLAYLFIRLTVTFLQTTGFIRNKLMDDVILAKVSAQLPDLQTGNYGPAPAGRSITVFLVGARINHPLGLFAPGSSEIGKYFTQLTHTLSTPEAAREYGIIGLTPWVGAERESGNGPMMVVYLESEAGLHKFAHDPLHVEAWKWMASHSKQYPHLGIWHESFTSEAGKWEAIYANNALLGLGAGAVPVIKKNEESGITEEMWYGTLVDASKGILRSSRGRLGVGSGDDDKFDML